MKKSLLLVEDSKSDEKLTLRALKNTGLDFEIAVARDGAEALDYLFRSGKFQDRDASEAIALVLLDLNLPRVNGLEVLRRIRADQRTRVIPVVALTASRESEDVARCYELGGNGYLRKPLDFVEFSEVARVIARFWMELNEMPPPAPGSS